jgi:hypothetical protein
MSAPRSMGGLAALAVVLVLGLILGRTQRIEGPSRAELARALSLSGVTVATGELRSVDCEPAPSGGYDCRWQQHVRNDWQAQSGAVVLGAQGWRMANRPAPD